MIVRELVTRLGFSTDTASLQRYEGAVNHAKRISGLAAAAMRSAFALGGGAGLAAFGHKLAEVSDRITTLKGRLTALSQGGDFDQLADRARSLGAGMDDYIDGYIRLANATDGVLGSQTEVAEILDTLNAGLKASGADAGTAAGVMRQFGQALGSGTLRGDELNSMNEGAGVLMRELARAILGPNGTVGALKQMAAQGKLTTDVVLAGMRKIGPGLQAQTKGMGRSVGQAARGLRDTIDRVIARFDAATGFTRRLTAQLDWLAGAIERGVAFFGGMDSIATSVGATLGVIALTHLPAITKALAAATAAAWRFILPFLPAVVAASAIFLVVQDLYHWIEGKDSVAGRLFGDFKEVADKVKQEIDAIKASMNEANGGSALRLAKLVTADGRTELFAEGKANADSAAATLRSAIWQLVTFHPSAAWDTLTHKSGARQEINATTTVNIQGSVNQAAVNEIGRTVDQAVRGAASRAAAR
jgi:tape measure domain-containing protein